MRIRPPFSPVLSPRDRVLAHHGLDRATTMDNDAKNLAGESVRMRMEDGWLTLRQAMAYLCVSHVSLGRLIKTGRIRAFKPDYGTHTVMVSLEDVRAVLADSARRAGMIPGCVNDVVPQVKAGKAGRRKKEDPRKE